MYPRIFLLAFILLSGITTKSFSQNKYWIFFDEKTKNDKPEISEQTIKNRLSLGLETVQESDFPVKAEYIETLKSNYNIHKINVSRWLNAISANLTYQQKEEIKNLKFIKSIQPIQKDLMICDENTKIKARFISENIRISYPLVQIGYKEILENGLTGENVKIGVIDAGFYRANVDSGLLNINFKKQIIATRDFVNPEKNKRFFEQESKSDFHGTEVLKAIGGYNFENQILYGYAINSEFYLARTDSGNREFRGEEDNWIAALEWLDSLGVRLVNTSLGYSQGFSNPAENYQIEDMNGQTSIIAKGANIAAKQKGMILVVSAGNEGKNEKWKSLIASPADSEETIAVAANDEFGLKMDYSSIGPEFIKYNKPNISSYSIFGTSLAAPIITGLIATILQKDPNLTLNELKTKLFKAGNNYPYPNNFVGVGYPKTEYLFGNKDLRKIHNLKKSNRISLPSIPDQEFLIFHKKNKNIVSKQEILNSDSNSIMINKETGVKFTTIISKNEIWEIKWR